MMVPHVLGSWSSVLGAPSRRNRYVHRTKHRGLGTCEMRRDGRVVEGGGLENRCGGNSTLGSNPSPSANVFSKLRAPRASTVRPARPRFANQLQTGFAQRSVSSLGGWCARDHFLARAGLAPDQPLAEHSRWWWTCRLVSPVPPGGGARPGEVRAAWGRRREKASPLADVPLLRLPLLGWGLHLGPPRIAPHKSPCVELSNA